MADPGGLATRLLEHEARGLLARLDQVRPFALHETMVLAAAVPYDAQLIIERFLHASRGRLREKVHGYLDWLHGQGRGADAAEQQRRFVLIRLGFNDVLSQFDLFTEVITQRSEHETGVWLSGLDVLARDALRLELDGYEQAPAVCYLSRGPGAAIRRARTRLPGGVPNPVAIIRVPRERMVGSGIASSLVHEVGHQGAAQLRLVESLRLDLAEAAKKDPQGCWPTWDAWISEIVADCWSVGKLGIASTVGLLAVVSLPAFFVFRPSGRDPHPVPYLRVLVSATIGEAIYPHPQWAAMRHTWKQLYPTNELPAGRRTELERLEASIPEFVRLLLAHRSPALHGQRLGDIWPGRERHPTRLIRLHRDWAGDVGVMARQPSSLVFAVIGQAKAAGLISPEAESRLLSALLRAWAVRSSLDVVQRPPSNHLPSARRAS
ncbi:hypothetical protein ACGFIF_28225 [Kribbella sp. NPDC049174]|uniref:hypothetical protein n=1 Tax=Kribbella sp. NPDC049174 TaxID=3364112 RepID=UPI00371B3A03